MPSSESGEEREMPTSRDEGGTGHGANLMEVLVYAAVVRMWYRLGARGSWCIPSASP